MKRIQILLLGFAVLGCLWGCAQEVSEPAPIEEVTEAAPIPVFSNHVPFLFADEDGMLHPEDPFTADDLTAALRALADDPALLPELPTGTQGLTGEQLQEILEPLFPDVPYPHIQSELTRAKAAFLLDKLLERVDETVSPTGSAFPDVPPSQPGYVYLMEAACPHTGGDTLWIKIELTTGLEPGWNISRGKLRMLDGNGFMVRSTVIDDSFTIDDRGWYTSGNEELDQFIQAQLARFQQEAPQADRLELLRMANNYVRDSFKYLRRNPYYPGFTGWEIQDALDMFHSGLGNCYSFAGMFWAFAKNLGYEAIAISGNIGSRPHGWVLVKSDEDWRYCDPELEMSIREEKRYELDLFMQPRGQGLGIEYIEPW